MNIKKTVKGVYAIWYREFKVFLREKSRIVSSIFTPLLWLFVFGVGIGSITSNTAQYQHFIFPGFIVMAIVFNALFYGVYVVWDKRIDFLKEVLITPLSRTTIFTGKVIGGITDSFLQSSILILLGIIIGTVAVSFNIFLIFLMVILLGVGLVSLGLIIGAFMERPEGFGIISSFIVYPMFLLSGALYPLQNLPPWMKYITGIDPATYAVDGLRGIILGASAMPLATNIMVLAGFDIVMIAIGTWSFNRMRIQ